MADRPLQSSSSSFEIMKAEEEEKDYGQILQVIKEPAKESRDSHHKKFPLSFEIKLPNNGKKEILTYEQLREQHPYLLISYFQTRANIRDSEDPSAPTHPKEESLCKQEYPCKKQDVYQASIEKKCQSLEQQAEPIHHDYLNMREAAKDKQESKQIQNTGCYDVFLGQDSLYPDLAVGLIDCESVFADIGLTPFSSPVYFEPIDLSQTSIEKLTEEYEFIASREKIMIID